MARTTKIINAGHVLITGGYGLGGKSLIRSLAGRFHDREDIATIIVNFFNNKRKKHYAWDYYFTPETIEVPYFAPDQKLGDISSILTASFGLSDQMMAIIHDAFKGKDLPPTIIPILREIAGLLKKTKQVTGEDYYGFLHLYSEFKSDKGSLKNVNWVKDAQMEWMDAWNSNESIIFNLLPGLPEVQFYIFLQALLILNILTPENPSGKPIGFIIIEEPSYRVFAPQLDVFSRYNLLLEKVIVSLFDELSRKGIYFIIEDDQPSSLYSSLTERFATKFFFRTTYPQNSVFDLNDAERNLIDRLPNMKAITLKKRNGVELYGYQ
jgi:uncharacterized protein (DUF2249 family)